MRLFVVNFTEIQMYIYDKCPHDELTIIMRRYMMKIAEYFANKEKAQGLITGESIGQVASQTMQSLAATNEVCTMPVFRPVIAFDKQEIVDISLKIGTYETSILPYEDCCTTFVAKHPVTKPNINVIKNSEKHLAEEIDRMFEDAKYSRSYRDWLEIHHCVSIDDIKKFDIVIKKQVYLNVNLLIKSK